MDPNSLQRLSVGEKKKSYKDRNRKGIIEITGLMFMCVINCSLVIQFLPIISGSLN